MPAQSARQSPHRCIDPERPRLIVRIDARRAWPGRARHDAKRKQTMTEIRVPTLGESVTRSHHRQVVQEGRRRRRGRRAAGRARDRQGHDRSAGARRPACSARSSPRTARPSPSARCSARSPKVPRRRASRPPPAAAPKRRSRCAGRRAAAGRRRLRRTMRRGAVGAQALRRERRRCRRPCRAPARTAASPRATCWPRSRRPRPRRPRSISRPPPCRCARRRRADDAAREERVKMTRLRQTIARRLKDAQNTAAMLTTFNEVDMTPSWRCAPSTRTCSRRSTA